MNRYNRYNREIPEDCRVVEHNGHAFIIGTTPETMRRRYDPLTIALGAAAAGTALQVASTLKEGKQAEKLAEQRAAIDLQNADQVRKQAVEAARIEADKGRKALATAKSTAAASGIRINIGSPLVIDTEIRNNIAKETGFILERGRAHELSFRDSAAINIAQGKNIRRNSKTSAIAQGLFGASSIAFMGMQSGAFTGGTTPVASPSGPSSLNNLNTGGGSRRFTA
jgi:hypothetical protein